MSLIARCPRCRRRYTAEEYEVSRFCRDCGTLLRLREAKTKRGGGMSWLDLFPYEPYPAQTEFMEDVARVVGSGGTMIAEACNGFGKTAAALSSLLALGKRIVYATRTHEQVKQVLAELEAINAKAGARFTSVNLASREHLCLNPECRDLPRREAAEACRALREGDSCPYSYEVASLPRGLPAVLGSRTLMEAGRRSNICPYFLARRVARSCTVVVAPYIYVFDPNIRDSVGLDYAGKIVVMDEGHNLDRVGQEVLSDTLSVNALEAAGSELKSIGRSQRHMRALASLLRERVHDGPLVMRDGLVRDLELTLGAELHGFADHYADAVTAIRTLKLQRGEPPVCHLNGVLSFISLIASSRGDRYVGIYQRNPYGVETIEYRCLDPSLAIAPVVEQAAGTLIMSGTLSPLELFADILGLGGAELKSYPAIQSSEEISMVIDAGVTTRFDERSEETILNIGTTIALDLVDVPNGALIFFPQRQFMNGCLDTWGENRIVEARNGRLYMSGKPVFIEGRDAEENREVVESYKTASATSEGAVLLGVFRGRNSEGSNFPDEQARGIFLVGVPYANYGDPLVQAQMRYFNRRSEGLGRRWYTMDAFRAANQAMGRGIRGRDDWCRFWLLDKRYTENIGLLPKWALGSGPQIRGGEVES